MEKLQAALRTARQSRSNMPGVEPVLKTRTRKTMRQVSASSKWTDLAEFTPTAEALRENRIVTKEASSDATPFDILRTKILLQMRQNGWTRLAITSPMPQSGKTTTACNLALGLGRQKELRSMLLDLDLREPSVHDFFQRRPTQSIARMLEGGLSFADQAMRIDDNLAISMSTGPESDPARIMLSEHTEDILDEIQRDYEPDIMIFDLPSVLVNDDTRAFLKNVDCALIVSRANVTRYAQFDNCEREIAEHTNVLGCVLNACRSGGLPND